MLKRQIKALKKDKKMQQCDLQIEMVRNLQDQVAFMQTL